MSAGDFYFCTLCVRLRRLHLLRLVILDTLRVDGNGLDTLVFKRAVHVVGWNICNLIHDIQAIHDLAESSIASVEMRTILVLSSGSMICLLWFNDMSP